MMKKGKLYGIGVGPGDPELLTLKACRLLEQIDYIAFPGKTKETTYACQIIEKICENYRDKQFIPCPVKMTKNRDILEQNYESAAEKISRVLLQGADVAFVTIGDPTIYSSYLYVHKKIQQRGFDAELINGIPSFCAAAAQLNTGLCERKEQMHLIPSSYEVDKAMKLSGTKVFMKAGKQIAQIQNLLDEETMEVYMIENCGMGNQKISREISDISEIPGYLTLIVVKDK